MTKKLKIIVLEHIGDTGDWEWYSIQRNTTAKKAVKEYIAENLDDNNCSLITDDDGYIGDGEGNCRAIELFI